MKRPSVTLTVAVAICWSLAGAGVAVATTHLPAGAKAPASGTWRNAIPVPGLPALNVGGTRLSTRCRVRAPASAAQAVTTATRPMPIRLSS